MLWCVEEEEDVGAAGTGGSLRGVFGMGAEGAGEGEEGDVGGGVGDDGMLRAVLHPMCVGVMFV